MNRQWKGIVFMDFRDEKAPNFILNLVEELQRENIAEGIAPCQTFSKSFMMVSPSTKRKDLVLLLRPMDEDIMSRLEQWRTNNQEEQVIMMLSEYVKQYGAEFTGIGQTAEAPKDSGRKTEQKHENASTSRKSKKKDRHKRNHPSEEVNNKAEEAGNESNPEENVSADDGTEASNEAEESG